MHLTQTQQPAGTEAPSPSAPVTSPLLEAPSATAPAFASREAALAARPRVKIESPSLIGSINLKGGRIDDVAFRDYTTTVDPNSAKVVLFSPSGSPAPYFAVTGWLDKEGRPIPADSALWEQEGSGALTATHPVVLRYDSEGLAFRRTFSVDDRYMFTVTDEVENKSSAPVTLTPWGQVARFIEPKTSGYQVLEEGLIGSGGKIERVTYANAIKNYIPGRDVPEEVKDGVTIPAHREAPRVDKAFNATGGWAGVNDQYWAAWSSPIGDIPHTIQSLRKPDKQFYADMQATKSLALAPGERARFKPDIRRRQGERASQGLRDLTEYQPFDYLIDWGWFELYRQADAAADGFLYKIVGNLGLAILLTTVLVKLLFFPLANKSFESMSKMKKLQPELKKLQERFKDDKPRQQQAMMALYKKEKVNPMAGCLPILIQIPVFFSLYKVLLINIEMRHAPFFGWITDLSARRPDHGVQPLRPDPLDSAAVPDAGRAAARYGRLDVGSDAAQSDAARPGTAEDLRLDARHLHLHAGALSGGTGALLDGEQHPVLRPAGSIMKRQGVDIDIMHNVGIKGVRQREKGRHETEERPEPHACRVTPERWKRRRRANSPPAPRPFSRRPPTSCSAWPRSRGCLKAGAWRLRSRGAPMWASRAS